MLGFSTCIIKCDVTRLFQGFISGGKDGVVCLWDDSFTNTLKKYQLHSSAIEGGGVLHSDLPPVRALVLGQGKILVGTKNSEVSGDHPDSEVSGEHSKLGAP